MTTRNHEIYRVASEYARTILGYETASMSATQAFNAVRAIARANNWTLEHRESVWNTELKYALRFWNVSTADLMACNH